MGQVNRATAQSSHARAIDEGLAPLMRYLRALMNRIIATEFASPDLEFAWEETRAQDPGQAAQIDVAYVGAGILTVDEVRANLGLLPLEKLPKTAQKKTSAVMLRKDSDDEDSDDDGDEEGGSSGNDDDSGDSSDSGDFDSKHPRWAGGSPGGIGGQFAPKDSGSAATTLHDAMAQDAGEIQVASSKEIAVELAAESQRQIRESQERAEESAESKGLSKPEEMDLSDTPPSLSNTMESIGDAIAATPYVGPKGILLNADSAIINPNKILGYSLDPSNDKGASKAVVFNSALGYNQSNADDLIQQLKQGVAVNTGTVKGVDQYGIRFTVDIPVKGPNGNTATVRTGWIYDPGSSTPRLITALIKK